MNQTHRDDLLWWIAWMLFQIFKQQCRSFSDDVYKEIETDLNNAVDK